MGLWINAGCLWLYLSQFGCGAEAQTNHPRHHQYSPQRPFSQGFWFWIQTVEQEGKNQQIHIAFGGDFKLVGFSGCTGNVWQNVKLFWVDLNLQRSGGLTVWQNGWPWFVHFELSTQPNHSPTATWPHEENRKWQCNSKGHCCWGIFALY